MDNKSVKTLKVVSQLTLKTNLKYKYLNFMKFEMFH